MRDRIPLNEGSVFCWAKVQARLAYSGAGGVLCTGCSVLLLHFLQVS